MNLSDKERAAKRRKRNIIAKKLREDGQFKQRVISTKYNRNKWKKEARDEPRESG